MTRALCALSVIAATVALCTPTAVADTGTPEAPEPVEVAQVHGVIHQVVVYVDASLTRDLVVYVAWWEQLLEALTPPPPPPPAVRSASPPAPSPPGSPAGGTSGTHSDAWWQGVSVCEQSGRNDPYYGYFSIMDGSAGGKPWADQVAQANGIIARYGDSAWAASCVTAGYRASPGG
jgi:hypothetical protein